MQNYQKSILQILAMKQNLGFHSQKKKRKKYKLQNGQISQMVVHNKMRMIIQCLLEKKRKKSLNGLIQVSQDHLNLQIQFVKPDNGFQERFSITNHTTIVKVFGILTEKNQKQKKKKKRKKRKKMMMMRMMRKKKQRKKLMKMKKKQLMKMKKKQRKKLTKIKNRSKKMKKKLKKVKKLPKMLKKQQKMKKKSKKMRKMLRKTLMKKVKIQLKKTANK